jgi:hypothetical protein
MVIKKSLVNVFVLVFLIALVATSVYTTVHNRFDIGKKAAVVFPPSELPFQTSLIPVEITAGKSYTITLIDSNINPLEYNGYVFIKSSTCPNNNACKFYTGLFKDSEGNPVYFSNGQAVIKTLDTLLDSVMFMRFTSNDPIKKNGWSNEVKVTIKKTSQLPTPTPANI